VVQSGKWRFREDVEKLMGIVRKRKVILYPRERGGVPQALERPLGGPPGLMKIFKLR